MWPKSGVSGKKNLTHFTRTSGTPAEDCAWLAVEIEPVDLADEDEDDNDDEVVDGGKRPPRRPPPSVEVVAAV